MPTPNIFRRLLTSTFGEQSHTPIRKRNPLGRGLEQLEAREVPATVALTNGLDAIAENSTAQRSVTFTAGTDFAAGSVVSDVNVSIRFAKGLIAFPLNNQVRYRLTSPGGTTVTLIPSGMWASGTAIPSGFVTMTFDDSAATAVNPPGTTRPTTGTFRPANALSAFNGEAATGTWTLSIQDTALLQPLFHDFVTVTVTANEPPTNVDAGGPYTISEGDSLTLSGSATDPESGALSYSWDVNGDGTFGDATGANPTLNWADLIALGINDGFVGSTRNVSVQVSDGVTAPVTSTSTLLTIDNFAPSVESMSGPTTLNEGDTGTYSLVDPTDPSPVDKASLHYSFALLEADLAADYDSASGTNSFSNLFTDNGTYTVFGRVYDKDGGISSTVSTVVTVSNLDPSASGIAGPAFLALTQVGVYSLTDVVDPSSVDTDSLRYSFATSPGSLAANYDGASGTNEFNFSSPTLGTYTIYGRVYDKDGGISPTYSTVVIVNAGTQFDLKATVQAPPVEGWKKAWQGTKYNASTGYGWSQTSSVGGGMNGVVPSHSNAAVMGDYAYGVTTATFQVFVGAFQSATVNIYSYGTASQGKPGVAAKIGNGPTSTLTTNGVLTISGTAGADGILNITFNRVTGKALWIVSAIEVNAGIPT